MNEFWNSKVQMSKGNYLEKLNKEHTKCAQKAEKLRLMEEVEAQYL